MNRLMLTRPPARLPADKSHADAALVTSPLLTAALLYERYLESVFGYVTRRVSPHQEAEDITAEVFAAAFAGLPGFRGDLPLAWLLGIARRKIADGIRRRGKRRETLASELAATSEAANALLEKLGASAPNQEQMLQQQEARQHIRALMDALHPDQREALLLQYVEELSIAEIATVMQRSPHAINSLLQRARANIFRQGRAYFLPDAPPDAQTDTKGTVNP